MKMAKATESDINLAMIVIGMIDDIERGDYPRRTDGQHHEEDPLHFDPESDADCRAFVERLLAMVSPRAAGGALMRVVFGMDTVMRNDVFDPELDHLSWHPDLLPVIEERERRRALEKAKADPSTWQVIEWKDHQGKAFAPDFCGGRPGHYSTGQPEHGWVLRNRSGSGDVTQRVHAPEPGMEPVFVSKCWIWVNFGKEAS